MQNSAPTVCSFKVAGVTHDNRQQLIAALADVSAELYRQMVYDPIAVELVPEPSNPYDPNAIRVVHGDDTLGYVPRDMTHTIRAMLEAGVSRVYIREFTGGVPRFPSRGLVVVVSRLHDNSILFPAEPEAYTGSDALDDLERRDVYDL